MSLAEAIRSPPLRTPAIVPTLLRRYGEATREVMAGYLTREAPSPYLDALVASYPQRPGKMMRAGICIATACAFGGRLQDAVRCAAAIELFHNALLVHDDIEDESDERRGRPTLHAEHGVPLAINAGDALMLLAMSALADALKDLEGQRLRTCVALTQEMARQTAEGQALELGWRKDNRTDVTEADYLGMVLKKTAWASTIWPSQLGVLIGSRGACDPGRVVRFGFFLGAAFQIQDDLLNLEADAAYGKESCGDLYEGKRTLMLIHALSHGSPAERSRIAAMLGLPRSQRTPEMVADILEVFDRLGSVDHARVVAGGLAGAASREFELAYGALQPSPDVAFLEGLAPWVFERT
ncbi:MAG TPA: polyprenyl synthetase family protein [Phenylobacterium sp.]